LGQRITIVAHYDSKSLEFFAVRVGELDAGGAAVFVNDAPDPAWNRRSGV